VTPLEVLRRYQAHDYTLLGVLASRARAIPEHSFMEFGDARLTYSQTLELGEDEVLLAVVKKTGSTLTEHALAQWCRARLAPFKVPRYVLFVDALPHTPTHRIAKFEMRKDPTLKLRAVDLAQ